MSERTLASGPTHAELLLDYLQRERESLIGSLDDLDEYDVRRPMTPSGTSLLGLVKHVASVELGYLGECVGRPWPDQLPWDNELAFTESTDMWAQADETREELLDLYRRSWAHGDESVRTLGLEARATVPWWPAARRETTLGHLLVRMLAETAHHAGHADLVREAIDGRGGPDHTEIGDEAWWQAFVARIQAAADAHRAD